LQFAIVHISTNFDRIRPISLCFSSRSLGRQQHIAASFITGRQQVVSILPAVGRQQVKSIIPAGPAALHGSIAPAALHGSLVARQFDQFQPDLMRALLSSRQV
jgi:hypothetical protein